MTWKPQRRQRWEGFSPEQIWRAVADDLDVLDGTLDEHVEEDEAMHREASEVFQEWKLASVTAQNRMLFAVIITLITALVALLVPLVTR